MDLNKATRDFRERKCQCARCLAVENNESCECETARSERVLGDNESKDGNSFGQKNAPNPAGLKAGNEASASGCGIDPGTTCSMNDNLEYVKNRNDSNDSDNIRIKIGATTYGRKSSVNEPTNPTMQGPSGKTRTGCHGLEYGEVGNFGRDTLGSPIYLKSGILQSDMGGRCARDRACEHDCGIETGCETACTTSKRNSNEKAGVRVCNNEKINTMVSFLLEGVGILVFFAVCTITFWITLGYYIAQMLVNLKKADRNVHVAISIVLGMLTLMFAITLVTQGQQFTHQRSKSFSIISKTKSLISHYPGYGCKTKSSKPKAIPMAMPKMKPKVAAKHQGKMTRKYTDCQGRAIYNTARRNSVVIEMKQPPTWLVWLNDFVNDFMNNR